jgi:hypothetical protein
MKRPLPTILIDRREQNPWTFGAVVVGRAKAPALPTLPATLAEGDYTVAGFQGRIVVERKSAADFLATLGQGRARFDREIARLSAYERAAIIVEGMPTEFGEVPFRWSDVIAGNYDSGLDPGSILGSIGSFWGRSHVWTFFGETRSGAELAARSFLLKAAKHLSRSLVLVRDGRSFSRFRRRTARIGVAA